ncbi:fused sensory histidine kinase in two-component regulatory system with KdpE: signal sensing protein; sensory histidine kinase [Paraburkholderia piptadeniae]|uniref:histidine kinase n=1 Tax=Paraburkholderia piptadeniae TaxID=1701573 RepID=A0A1N7RV56_9BURK|nr:sensor histidine kinase KdpD [Paraburkholderia piptadeniae]SIT38603.1 fused sensory histidine kinase in two-component regulatory system with KdpE: signal sensing protein; sensory histidine kinase [Paraburkholderia piptadeniae]
MNRPDPDELLDRIQRDEEKSQRGRLKIFFGASAGVGKTFAMLQAARRRKDEGVDVVVGIVETHGRKETLALIEGLEFIAPARIEYRGRLLAEFDLDAALARKPQLILVDELAHSNVQGSRHLKRWQDVQELLDAGIDVYTTVNVQHLESLNDVVGQITGIRVWETVPDRVFDLADEVTLVDLPPEELLDRLREGKVYMPQQAEHAVRNFFRKGNLIALRELALRRTADRVDAQMREYRADQSIERIWQARERIIVCVGAGQESSNLVRAAARLASSQKADWLAVYVETPRLQRLPDPIRKRTLDALRLASELGAETVTLQGDDVAPTVIAYARMRNVSKLVVGASSLAGWRARLTPSVAQQMVWSARDIDVTLVNSGAVREAAERHDAVRGFAGPGTETRRSSGAAYAYAFAICAAITAVASGLLDRIALANLVMLYLLGAVFTAARLGRGPGVMFSFLGVAAFDFFFVPPRMSFTVADTQYLLTFAVMLMTSLTISHLTASLKRQARLATLRERRTGAMFAMTRELGGALMTDQIIEIGMRHVSEVFQARTAILLPDSAEKVRPKVENPDPAMTLDDADLDRDIAQWVYDQQKPAGHGTETLPAATALYLPLKAPMRTRGVMALLGARMDEFAVPEQRRMLDTFVAQIALALERVHYVEIAQDALVSMESERLRNSLLSAISHDLRTPLTAIVGFASVLAEQGGAASGGRQAQELAEAIHDEALRMTGVVTNLLDMARLQEGSMRLNRQWSSIEEVVGAAIRDSRRMLGKRRIQTRIPSDLPLVQLDAVLVERLFANLFENAAKYTPADSTLMIDASVLRDDGHRHVRVEVTDSGPGLPAGMESRVFDKFTRGEKESAKPGIGLGLSICRAIVEAHGGRIGASNRTDESGHVLGATFWFLLPADENPPDESGVIEPPDEAVEPAQAAHAINTTPGRG